MLMMWIGIWRFFVQYYFQSTFNIFSHNNIFFLLFFFFWIHSILRQRKKNPFFYHYNAKAHVHVNALTYHTNANVDFYTDHLIRFCVYNIYLYTLIRYNVNHLPLCIGSAEYFCYFGWRKAEREKNHTTSTIAFTIHSNEERNTGTEPNECACESSFDPQYFHERKKTAERMWLLRLYCCTLCTQPKHTHTAWYIFVHWV